MTYDHESMTDIHCKYRQIICHCNTYGTGLYPYLSTSGRCIKEGCMLCPLLVENLIGSSSLSSGSGVSRPVVLDFSLCAVINDADVGEETCVGASLNDINRMFTTDFLRLV